MEYFIDRDKYFNFEDRIKENNIINKISYKISNPKTDNVETVLASTDTTTPIGAQSPIGKLVPSVATTDGTLSEYYVINEPSVTRTNIQFQLTYEDFLKYNKISYNIKGLRVHTVKTTTSKFGSTNVNVDITYGRTGQSSISETTESDYEILSSGSANLDSVNYIVTQDIYEKTIIKSSETHTVVGIFGLNIGIETVGTFDYFTNIYAEIVGVTKDIDYADNFIKLDEFSKHLYNVDIPRNSFLQERTTISNIKAIDYISNSIFDEYVTGRPFARLEWVGSPYVKIGDYVKIEPKGLYNKKDLISYFVVGKTINFDGGYKETLLLEKMSVNIFNITHNDANYTLSNTQAVIKKNSSYVSNVNVEDGYLINNVVITMNGIDITSTAYNDGVISISSVTGDIDINITTREPELYQVNFDSVIRKRIWNFGTLHVYNGDSEVFNGDFVPEGTVLRISAQFDTVDYSVDSTTKIIGSVAVVYTVNGNPLSFDPMLVVDTFTITENSTIECGFWTAIKECAELDTTLNVNQTLTGLLYNYSMFRSSGSLRPVGPSHTVASRMQAEMRYVVKRPIEIIDVFDENYSLGNNYEFFVNDSIGTSPTSTETYTINYTDWAISQDKSYTTVFTNYNNATIKLTSGGQIVTNPSGLSSQPYALYLYVTYMVQL